MSADAPIPLPAKAKPRYGSACNHCGLCCQLSLCKAAQLFDPEATAPCKHLRFVSGDALCDLVSFESDAGLPPVISAVLGIGIGCSMQDPNTTEFEVAAMVAKHTAFAADIRKKFAL